MFALLYYIYPLKDSDTERGGLVVGRECLLIRKFIFWFFFRSGGWLSFVLGMGGGGVRRGKREEKIGGLWDERKRARSERKELGLDTRETMTCSTSAIS